jgi:hypothetical protein
MGVIAVARATISSAETSVAASRPSNVPRFAAIIRTPGLTLVIDEKGARTTVVVVEHQEH